MKKILLSALTLLFTSQAFSQPAQSPPFGQAPAPAPSAIEEPDAQDIAVLALIERLADEMDKEFIFNAPMLNMAMTSAGEDADYESLLAILRASGYVAIDMGDQIYIGREIEMRSLPSRVLNEDDRRVSDHEIVTRVIELPEASDDKQGIAAAQLVPILRPMLPQNAQLGAPVGANSLIVVDHYDNVRRITEIVHSLVERMTD